MPLHIPPVVGRNVSVHEAQGTSGTVTAGDTWALLPEMTLTLALNAGDDLLVMFTGSLYQTAYRWGLFRFCVDGVPISMEHRAGNQSSSSAEDRRSVYSAIKSYAVPVAGNYTVTVEWVKGALAVFRSHLNERCLTVVRFY